MPVPRLLLIEVRFALSKEPLKTILRAGYSCSNLASVSATSRQRSMLSSEQGPAMRRSLSDCITYQIFFKLRSQSLTQPLIILQNIFKAIM